MTTATTTKEARLSGLQTIAYDKMTWAYVERPNVADVEFIARRFSFHPLNLEDILSKIQRPKIDEYRDHMFIVLHFPVFNKTSKALASSEVDCFVGENFVVTIHNKGDLKPLSKFFEDCKADEDMRRQYLGRGSGYLLYSIIDRLVDTCFPILNSMIDKTDQLEEVIFTKPVPTTVKEISFIRRDLITFRRVMHPQIAVIQALELEDYPFLKAEQDVYFGDIADHVRKIWDGLEDIKETVDGLLDTSNWLTSHRIQEIMRVLTIVLAVMAPPTLIASFYGMNIALPGGINPGGYEVFAGMIVLMLALLGGAAYYFHRRKWI